MNDETISIIIPAFNEEETLRELLPYLKKTGRDAVIEIIVADGGSSDRTVEVAEKHGANVRICSRKGRAAQMNEGADSAVGDILYFLHADTTPPLDFVDQIGLALSEGYPAGCFRLLFDDPHPVLKIYGWFTRFSATLLRFGDQSLYVKKNLFNRVGGFDESMVVMEDQKIVRELKKRGQFRVMKSSVRTSSRRYKVNGEIRLQLVFTLILIMYYLGASQKTLVHIYQSFIHPVE